MKTDLDFIKSALPFQRCEKCWHYHMIDSAYGYCRRFPPTVQHPNRKVRHRFIRYIVWKERYPIVTFDNIACAEFKGGRPTTYQELLKLEKADKQKDLNAIIFDLIVKVLAIAETLPDRYYDRSLTTLQRVKVDQIVEYYSSLIKGKE